MNKVLQATSRGQVTLPKNWRDQFDTNYFEAVFDGETLTLKPIKTNKSFEETVEDSWNEYKEGEIVEGSDLMKKYAL